jgi:hypothetical protein
VAAAIVSAFPFVNGATGVVLAMNNGDFVSGGSVS